MEHGFWEVTLNLECEFYILIGNIYLNQKTAIKNIFWKFSCIFINAVIGWNSNILNVLGQIILVP